MGGDDATLDIFSYVLRLRGQPGMLLCANNLMEGRYCWATAPVHAVTFPTEDVAEQYRQEICAEEICDVITMSASHNLATGESQVELGECR